MFLLYNIDNLFCQNYVILPNQNEIKINGNIVLKQFYGPPNYGETPEIDRIEDHYVLILYEPISFSNGFEIIIVEEIQLIFNINKTIRNINSNWDYIVTGEAFFKQTGHHHTPVVILVVDLITLNADIS
jgi:hypothetical protein